ncbi:hypothetical protein ACTP2L_06935, partial [Campylobacter jejuni]
TASVVRDGNGGYFVVDNRRNLGTDRLSGIERASFINAAFALSATTAGMVFTGSAGNDTLTGTELDDSISGAGLPAGVTA